MIAVRDGDHLMDNDLAALPWAPGQFRTVENDFEAAGLLCAIRSACCPTDCAGRSAACRSRPSRCGVASRCGRGRTAFRSVRRSCEPAVPPGSS